MMDMRDLDAEFKKHFVAKMKGFRDAVDGKKDKRCSRKSLGDYVPEVEEGKKRKLLVDCGQYTGRTIKQCEDLLKHFPAGDGGAFNFGDLNGVDFAFWSGQNKDLSKAFELVAEDVQNRILDLESSHEKILVCLEKILERDNFGRGMDEVARVLHYPDCWDTMAYPTLADALVESLAGCCGCSTCAEAVNDKKEKGAKNG